MQLKTIQTITLEIAQELVRDGIQMAENIGSPSNIAVVDAFGNLIAHARMDEAQIPSIEHSINKAYTSALFKMPTMELKSDTEPGGELYGLNLTLNSRVIVFAGGMPLEVNDQIVGAVGVSGGTADQDQQIAKAVADGFQSLVSKQ